MTTNDTNGYLPYDDDTFEKNLGYHDGYTEGERERMEELVNENKEAFDAAIKQADDGQVTIAVRRQRDDEIAPAPIELDIPSHNQETERMRNANEVIEDLSVKAGADDPQDSKVKYVENRSERRKREQVEKAAGRRNRRGVNRVERIVSGRVA